MYSNYDLRCRAVRAVVEQGMPVVSVAKAYGVGRSTLYRWLERYKNEGEEGLLRRPGSGRPPKLRELDERRLKRIVLAPASKYGFETDLWTTRRLLQVLKSEFGITVSKQTVARRLRAAGITYQKPERQYFEASEQEREEWLRKVVPEIKRTVRKYRAILYFEDEASVSLTAMLGKTWAERGRPRKVRVTGRRGSLSALSAITKQGQLVFRIHEKRIASQEVIEFLDQLLKHHPRRHLVVVMDQAPPHVSKNTEAYIARQRRLHVFYLPKYSPDWNPDEKVWQHLKHNELKAHQARTKAELKALTERKLHKMAKEPRLIRGLYFRCCISPLFD